MLNLVNTFNRFDTFSLKTHIIYFDFILIRRGDIDVRIIGA